MRIIFLELPHSLLHFGQSWMHVPYTVASLLANAQRHSFPKKVTMELLSGARLQWLGDAALLKLISSKNPDAVVFNLTFFNTSQSLFIARKIKERMPETTIVAGGEVVAPSASHIIRNSAIDMGYFGEGEFVLVDILKEICKNNHDLSSLNGVFFRCNKRVAFGKKNICVADLHSLVSPYLEGILQPQDYTSVCIEASRGCINECLFCKHQKIPFRVFPVERCMKELRLFRSRGVRQVCFLDSYIHPVLHRELLEALCVMNKDKFFAFDAGIRADEVTPEFADMLSKCNFVSALADLQTANKKVLKGIKRPCDLKKFVAGIRYLEKKKIKTSSSLLLGLPNESFRSFRRSWQFAKRMHLKRVGINLLCFDGNSGLGEVQKRLKIKFYAQAPYPLEHARYISNKEIGKALRLASRGSSHNELFWLSLSSGQTSDAKHVFSRVVLRLNKKAAAARIKSFIASISDNLSKFPGVLIRAPQFKDAAAAVRAVVSQGAKTNPFSVWTIVVQVASVFNVEDFIGLQNFLLPKDTLPLYGLKPNRLFIVLPWHLKAAFMKQGLFAQHTLAPFLLWSIELIGTKNKEGVLRELHSRNNKGIVFHFSDASDHKEKKWWFEVICREVKKVFPGKTVQFEDAVLTRALYTELKNEGQGVELMLARNNTAFFRIK